MPKKKVNEMYQILHSYHQSNRILSLTKSCSTLGVSRSGYADWVSRLSAIPSEADILLVKEIRKIAAKYVRYGYRRMTKMLERKKIFVCPNRVLEIMRRENLLVVRKKKFKVIITDSNHNHRIYPNLIKGLTIDHLNQVWAADITYVALAYGFVYVAAILDLFSRKCIGWAISESIDTLLTIDALQMAFRRRGVPLSGIIHHSDRGVQYAADAYVELLQENDMLISMSRKGNPYDNARVESFMKTFKYELVDLSEYKTIQDAKKSIGPFLDLLYNRKRIHSSLDYATPEEFESMFRMGA